MKIIFDTSSLILLIEKLKLKEPFNRCRETGIELIIPKAVWLEFIEKNNDYDILSFITENFQILNSDVYEGFDTFFDNDSGEIAAASISKEFQDKRVEYFCIIDESYGYKTFGLLELQVKRSIGFLLFLKEKGFISSSELLGLKDLIQKSNFRIKKEHLEKLR